MRLEEKVGRTWLVKVLATKPPEGMEYVDLGGVYLLFKPRKVKKKNLNFRILPEALRWFKSQADEKRLKQEEFLKQLMQEVKPEAIPRKAKNQRRARHSILVSPETENLLQELAKPHRIKPSTYIARLIETAFVKYVLTKQE